MTKFDLTYKEKTVLETLISKLYAEPGFSDVDCADISNELGWNAQSVGGVLSSLEKKGVVRIEELTPRNGYHDLGENGEGVTLIYLTEEAYPFHERWAQEEGIEYTPIWNDRPAHEAVLRSTMQGTIDRQRLQLQRLRRELETMRESILYINRISGQYRQKGEHEE